MPAPRNGRSRCSKPRRTTSAPLRRSRRPNFAFQIKNVFEEDAHIVMVQSSCDCTTPQVTRQDLKSYEIGEIIADFNTRDFQGHRSATMTVTLECVSRADDPIARHRLHPQRRGDAARGDRFRGTVDFGSPMEKTLQVTYAGRGDWRIVDVKTAEDYFEVEISEPIRGPARSCYDLLVRLTKDAPVGYIKDQLILVTNDPKPASCRSTLEGRVVPDITISPTKLFIGVVHPGETSDQATSWSAARSRSRSST